MTKTAIWMAALLLAAMTFSAQPAQANYDVCYNYDDDAGTGGSDVSCGPLDCARGSYLVVGAQAEDEHASIAASFNCGKTAAGCGSKTPVCAAASKVPAREPDSQKCKAESNEFWSSMVHIQCASIGTPLGDTEPIDKLCELAPGLPVCDDIATVCIEAGLKPELAATMFPAYLTGQPVLTLISIQVSPSGIVTALYKSTDTGGECSIEQVPRHVTVT